MYLLSLNIGERVSMMRLRSTRMASYIIPRMFITTTCLRTLLVTYVSQDLHHFSTFCHAYSYYKRGLTFWRVLLIPKSPPIGMLCSPFNWCVILDPSKRIVTLRFSYDQTSILSTKRHFLYGAIQILPNSA